MCGIVGYFNPSGISGRAIAHMVAQLRHRGPDAQSAWSDTDAGIAFGHARLSIVDLSAAGSQPMTSASGRYVVAFNGEIYNHMKLRQALEGANDAPAWRGHSDTETLLAGIEAWSLDAVLQKATGMFALALWDRRERTLTLARDRLGEKPLYYGLRNGSLVFASELKALKVCPDWIGEIDRDALTLLLRHNYIPAPYSIYRGIRKLTPGCTVKFSAALQEAEPEPFWDPRRVIASSLADPFRGTRQDAAAALDTLLREAVAEQMVADVPLGAFLSGGVDSSTVVALMQAQSSRPVKTFTIGFHEEGYDEAQHAKAVARHLGTDHTELYITPQQALEVVPNLPAIYCEPFADSSQIPTYLVSALTRRHVTVSLSGDAGDELFGGYTRYATAQRFWSKLSLLPQALRRPMASTIRSLSPAAWNRLACLSAPLLPAGLRKANMGDKIHKGAAILCASKQELYRQMVSQWPNPKDLVVGGAEPLTVLTDAGRQPRVDDFFQQMMALDTLSYLPDDILCKVDRAAMAVSLETRVPFLNHNVVEFAWRLPLHYKAESAKGKLVLRDVLYRYVPSQLIERPKMGFGIPLAAWLRGPLRDWAETLLDESRLRRDGYFNPQPIRQKWAEHRSGVRNWDAHLWIILMFQSWLDNETKALA